MILESAERLLAYVRAFGGPDVVVCDPPYSPHVHASAVSNNPGGVETGTAARDFGFAALDDHLLGVLLGIASLTRRWSVFFSDIESVGARWQPALGAAYVRAVPWVRWSQPQKSGDRPGSGCELIVVAHPPGPKQWNGPGSLTRFDCDGESDDGWAPPFGEKCLRGAEKYSAEKPLDLMLSLVSYFSRPGELVADPTAGVGTTGLACRLLDRRFIGAERRPEIRYVAEDRLARAELADRDRDRVERWVRDSIVRLENEVVTTPKAIERRGRRAVDVLAVAKKVGIQV